MGIDTSMLKFAKPVPRVVTKRAKRLDVLSQERICREVVRKRDKGRCVVPGCREKSAHLHHIVYRSRGGKWRSGNICSLCVGHHALVHAGQIQISGDANDELIITGPKEYLRFKL